MIARCARCQGTFTTDRFGRQTCPHCGSELILADPNAPPPSGGPGQGAPPAEPPASAGGLPPPPPPPPGGYGPPQGGSPAGGWAPPPGGGWGGPPGGGWGGPPPGAGPEIPSPFAERATRGFFASFFETWKLVATQPQEFFRRVRIDQTWTAILFAVISTTVGAVVSGMYGVLFAAQIRAFLAGLPGADPRLVERLGEMSSGRSTLAQIVITPIATVVSIYVGAAIFHVLLMLFRGAKRPFDATLTAVAYANGLYLLLVVPGCGQLVAIVWALVVLIIGLGEIQRCGSGKAAAAVFAPAILLCLCVCAAGAALAPALMKFIEEAGKHGNTVNL